MFSTIDVLIVSHLAPKGPRLSLGGGGVSTHSHTIEHNAEICVWLISCRLKNSFIFFQAL